MALSDIPQSIAYVTDGVSTAYPVPYYFAQQADLVVTFKDNTGAVTTKVLRTDYTIVGTLDPKLNTYNNGGTVNFATPLGNGGQVRITRKTPRSQVAVYQPNDPFPAGTLEAALDRPMLVLQDALDALGLLGIADGPPSSGSFNNGQWLVNTNPVPGGTFGWVFISGNWYELMPISGSPM